MSFKADLHMHSSYSTDGEIAPATLMRMAADAGMRCVAVSDHNRVDAVSAAIDAGRPLRMVVVPGIEIDCDFGDIHLHVLGYDIDHTADEYQELWETVAKNEAAAASLLMDRVEATGIAVDREKAKALAGDGYVIPEHVAEVVLADPRNDGVELLTPFRAGGPRSDNPFVNFYWDVCSPGKPAHVSVSYISLDECIRLIESTGGFPVIAHPGQNLRGCPERLADIARCGVRGVEAYSNYHTPEECARWVEAARENELFVTCGSDFHGKTKPAISIGRHGAGDDVETLLEGFFQALT